MDIREFSARILLHVVNILSSLHKRPFQGIATDLLSSLIPWRTRDCLASVFLFRPLFFISRMVLNWSTVMYLDPIS